MKKEMSRQDLPIICSVILHTVELKRPNLSCYNIEYVEGDEKNSMHMPCVHMQFKCADSMFDYVVSHVVKGGDILNYSVNIGSMKDLLEWIDQVTTNLTAHKKRNQHE